MHCLLSHDMCTFYDVLQSCGVVMCSLMICRVLQCAAVCCSVLQCAEVRCSVLQCVAVCCSVLQYDARCCSALQCVPVCLGTHMHTPTLTSGSISQYQGGWPTSSRLFLFEKKVN